MANLNRDKSHLRSKQRHFYDRVTNEKIDEYDALRNFNADRKQKLINNRFPELQAAREAFLGTEQKAPKKKELAKEVVEFSNAVEKLAMEEEPFAARA